MQGNGNAAYLTCLPVVLSSHLIFIAHFAISMKYKYHLAKFNFKKSFKLCNFTHCEAACTLIERLQWHFPTYPWQEG
jgi:hypothetical protein